MKKLVWPAIVWLAFTSCSILAPEKINVEIRYLVPEPIEGLTAGSVLSKINGDTLYVYQRIEITNSDIKEAESSTYRTNPALVLVLTEEGALKFSQLTRTNQGQVLGIFFNGNLIATPIIGKAVYYGKVIMHGEYKRSQIDKWAKGINAAIKSGTTSQKPS
jgi:preprotein translocase subunit SecD